jgi:hypothetical protein
MQRLVRRRPEVLDVYFEVATSSGAPVLPGIASSDHIRSLTLPLG